ncbi:hypothetical protein CAPTEDRAFT_206377 [Capitella teleta]|uniref:G-protein coupled receptors family 1 profile domain-containing protein n=1 Tax=Capitella teleta TaxID=283909 RepID=R7VEQ5_CAPTE|nr:hypothetical protein CAPTEDRAFT_206377 [Capitella teleta]|eukprot:ELU17067.1 hypothetical protein CAPTEDRAFT_206377 [Capitella teleta]
MAEGTQSPLSPNDTSLSEESELEDIIAQLYMPEWTKPLCVLSTVTGVITGTTGNILVMIFFFQRRKKIASNFFIFLLAVLDLFVCAVLLPCLPYLVYFSLELVLSTWFIYLHRIWGYIFIFSSIFSLFLFDVIAFDRHRAICTSMKRQLNYESASIVSLVGGFACVVLTLLAYYYKDVRKAKSPLIRNIGIAQIIGSSLLLILYLRMFRFLLIRQRQVLPGLSTNAQGTSSLTRNDPKGVHRTQLDVNKPELNVRKPDPQRRLEPTTSAKQPNSTTNGIQPSTNLPFEATLSPGNLTNFTKRHPIQNAGSSQLPLSQKSVKCSAILAKAEHAERGPLRVTNSAFNRKNPALKTIRMLFIMAVIFIASYLPVLVITTKLQKPVYLVFTYIINHVANPLVHFVMNESFRDYAMSVFKKVFKCKFK